MNGALPVVSALWSGVALAHAHGVQVNPHVWGSAVGQAASLQLIAAIPCAHHSLFADQPLLEFDTSAHPFREHLTDAPLRHRNGWVDVPQRPGLGIEVSREAMAKFGVQEKPNGARGG